MADYNFEPMGFDWQSVVVQSPTRKININISANVFQQALDMVAAYFPIEIKPAVDDYMTNTQKGEYGKLVGSVLNIVDSLSFRVENHHQTDGTYSYYIYFIPSDWNGELMDELVEAVFRVSEHDPDGGIDFSYNQDEKTLFSNFQIENVGDFYEAEQLLDAVRSLLERIKGGDFTGTIAC